MSANVSVFVRCRPLKLNERGSSLEIFDDENIVRVSGRDYIFDQVFSHESPQEEVFNAVVKPLINKVLNGYNCTVFAYGQTGTGKTFTMEGDKSADRLSADGAGMVPRAVTEIFRAMESRDQEFTMKVSFIEIFSEEVYDLLTGDNNMTKLRIFDDAQKKGSVVIDGAKEMEVATASDILGILSQGALKRQTATTLQNARSSRSHGIFSIKINLGSKFGKLNLVDLAGSECIARSGAQDKHAREAGNINQSLLTLTRVITALVEKRSHVPYRESKLTRILQDSLGGSTRTSMIATISPAEGDVNDTMGTLDYAYRARNITNRPEANSVIQKKGPDDFCYQCLELKEELNQKEIIIRNEVADEFKNASDNIKAMISQQFEQQIKQLNEQTSQQKHDIESLQTENERLQLEARRAERVMNEVVKVRNEFQERLENDLKQSLIRIIELEAEVKNLKEENRVLSEENESIKKRPMQAEPKSPVHPNEIENIQVLQEVGEEQMLGETKKASKIRKRAPAEVEECNDYANMTFDGDDEIVQVSSKKARPKVKVAGKKRDLYQALQLSGKKKRLRSTDDDAVDLSPISPPKRATRSRTTRRKLDY